MADVARENHKIKRQGYTKEMDKTQKSSSQQNEGSTSIRRTIVASRSGTKLMRQVSGLGMEDPVFRTNESGPLHPSNIFDDMGVNDIPTGMQDMVSVASDPTATHEEGLDIRMFEMSLNNICFHSCSSKLAEKRRPSLLDAVNPTELQNLSKLVEEGEHSPNRMEDTSASDSTPPNPASQNEDVVVLRRKPYMNAGSNVVNKSPRRVDSRKRLNQKKQPSREASRTSIQSLDLECVFSREQTKDANNSSRGVRTASTESSSSKQDNLLAEAARAMEKQGSFVSRELLDAAKSQHSTCPRTNNSGRRQRSSTKYISPIKEAENDVELDNDFPRKRVMPTLSGLFPMGMGGVNPAKINGTRAKSGMDQIRQSGFSQAG